MATGVATGVFTDSQLHDFIRFNSAGSDGTRIA